MLQDNITCPQQSPACRPYTGKPGPRIDPPLEETWQAMEGLVEDGLVRSIGISNFSPSKTQQVLKVAKIKPDVNQVGHAASAACRAFHARPCMRVLPGCL